MLKVVSVTDKAGSAIDRLAIGMKPFMDNIEYHVIPVHPKRPDQQQIAEWEQHYPGADVIDFGYYKTALILQNNYDLSDKPQLLQHHNPYAIDESDWSEFCAITANNTDIYDRLGKITPGTVYYLPNTIDTDFFTPNRDWEPGNRVLMVAARIEAKKGIKEVARACEQVGAKLVLVGSVSDPEYLREVMGETNVEFHQDVTDDELLELYRGATLHVCNSRDNFESGTNPILEAMLCGVPVLTRNIGHVPDLYDGHNMIINFADYDDVASLADILGRSLDNTTLLKNLRSKGWDTAKERSHERRAYMLQRIYRKLVSNQSPVSYIVPVHKNPAQTERCLQSIISQNWENKEIIVVEDDISTPNKHVVNGYAQIVNFPVRYMRTDYAGYGLAMARNMGVIEATGDILIFLDQRLEADPEATMEFMTHVKSNTWVYGNKDGAEKTKFVENFSAIKRDDFVYFGMFNERCTGYGALSQETRIRFHTQRGETEYVPRAKAYQIGKSPSKFSKQQEIIQSKNWLWKVGL